MPASKAQQARAEKRRYGAYVMRMAGKNWQEIADRLGYSGPADACKDYARYVEQLRELDHVRREVLYGRLDQLIGFLWGKAIRQDVRAALAIATITMHQARMLGPVPSPTGVSVVAAWVHNPDEDQAVDAEALEGDGPQPEAIMTPAEKPALEGRATMREPIARFPWDDMSDLVLDLAEELEAGDQSPEARYVRELADAVREHPRGIP